MKDSTAKFWQLDKFDVRVVVTVADFDQVGFKYTFEIIHCPSELLKRDLVQQGTVTWINGTPYASHDGWYWNQDANPDDDDYNLYYTEDYDTFSVATLIPAKLNVKIENLDGEEPEFEDEAEDWACCGEINNNAGEIPDDYEEVELETD